MSSSGRLTNMSLNVIIFFQALKELTITNLINQEHQHCELVMLPPPARRLGPPTFFTNSMERKPSQVKEEGKKVMSTPFMLWKLFLFLCLQLTKEVCNMH